MKIHYLQHVPYEGLASIANWADERGFGVSGTALYAEETLPDIDQLDWLIVMGGPMNIYEEDQYPWLSREKEFISECLNSGKVILGICLGAQLIADSLGGRVFANKYKEIGWFPVQVTQDLFNLPVKFTPFHWHGDTFLFSESDDVNVFARSEACSNQAFSYDNGRVVGLQFHLEVNRESISSLLEHCKDDLVEGNYVASSSSMLEVGEEVIKKSNRLMSVVLDSIYLNNQKEKTVCR